ncbi:MAG: TetR/AcrR family transcriptional regulator, partial [Pseudomonadales bacterium]
MPSSEEKRAAIIDRLAHALRDQGLGQSGLRGLATLAGTSDRMLIYYFGNKETLLRDVLDAMTAQISTILDEHLGNAQWDEDRLL